MSYEAVVRVLADLIVSIDLSGDDVVDPDFASSIFGDVSAAFDRLASADRAQISAIIVEYAEAERNVGRRQALLDFPEQFGLTEDLPRAEMP